MQNSSHSGIVWLNEGPLYLVNLKETRYVVSKHKLKKH